MILNKKNETKDFYNTVYGYYNPTESPCLHSISDLRKACKKVSQVFKAFDLNPLPRGARTLDVGCGLGYVSEALRLAGALVTGIDISQRGIDLARESFPGIDFRCASFPDEIEKDHKFNIIWALDLSIINAFDVKEINQSFIEPALQLLTPKGMLIVGWHTNFSGRTILNWSHWSIQMIKELQHFVGLSEPRIVEVPFFMNNIIIQCCRFFQKSAPIFFYRRINIT